MGSTFSWVRFSFPFFPFFVLFALSFPFFLVLGHSAQVFTVSGKDSPHQIYMPHDCYSKCYLPAATSDCSYIVSDRQHPPLGGEANLTVCSLSWLEMPWVTVGGEQGCRTEAHPGVSDTRSPEVLFHFCLWVKASSEQLLKHHRKECFGELLRFRQQYERGSEV